MDNNHTYIKILRNTLEKKSLVLDELYQLTILQESILKSEDQNMDSFDQIIDQKAILIESLDELDAGFENIYERVKIELSSNANRYREEVLGLQELIQQITDKGVKLQASELRNKATMETYFNIKKREVKDFKKNSQTAANYYKSMADRPQGESYFLDKKK